MLKKFNATCTDFFLLLVFMIGFGLFSLTHGQDANWDLLNYHYYNAYAFFNRHCAQNSAPALLQTYYNPLLDAFNYLIIQLVYEPKIIAFIMGSFSGIPVFFLVKSAKILFSDTSKGTRTWYLLLSTIIGVSGAAGLSQLGTFMNEYEISAFVMAAIYFILKKLHADSSKDSGYRYLFLSGLIMGLGAGLKLTAATYAIALIIATLPLKQPFILRIQFFIVLICSVAIGFFITEGFWMIKLYHAYGNPLFPYYNNIFHSSHAAISNYTDRHFLPKTLLQYFFYPFYWLKKNTYTAELSFRDAHLALVLLFAFLFMIQCMYTSFHSKLKNMTALVKQTNAAHFLCIFWLTSYTLWLTKFSIMRYTIPLELLSGLLITFFCIKLFKNNKVRMIVLLTLSLVCVFTTKPPNWGHVPFQHRFLHVEAPTLPKKSLVLIVGENPVAYLVPFFPDDTTFIRMDAEKCPGSQKLNVQATHNAIANYHGFLYSMHDAHIQISDCLNQANLIELHEQCMPIQSNLDKTALMICPLLRIKNRVDTFK